MAQNSTSERVLEIVRLKGPVIPSQISSEIGTSSLIASAILSELSSSKKVKISSLKVGGTPLYYAPGQEQKLQDYSKYLHEQERKALEMLKEKLVLQDKALEPVVRVALREIKDFAVQLNVQNADAQEIFWKWYLISNEEAEPLIKSVLGIDEPKEVPAEKIEPAKEAISRLPDEPKLKEVLEEKPKPAKPKMKKPESKLLELSIAYFRKNRIEIVQQIETKKKTDLEFIISVPTPVGSVKYYCRAKDKKSCSDADLSTAYVQGQVKKLPVLFLATGSLTKKAGQMLGREFDNINFKQI